MVQQPLIAIVGPTGSGKTALAVALARDLSLRGVPPRDDEAIPSGSRRRSAPRDDMLFELVSADSRQVYRGMDIGTGKERVADVPQHLIDIVNPDEEFTLADFLDRAKRVIADIHARGHVPIVVGGTGLYVQALVENWDIPAVKPNPTLRAELEKKNVSELQQELAAVDPEEAERLGPGKRYLIRALEMWHATGRKPSELKKKNEPLYDALVIGISAKGGSPPKDGRSASGGDLREELYARIDARVDDMFARGLVDEVRGLMEKYRVSHPEAAEGSHVLLSAFRTIGYREVMDILCHSGARPASGRSDRIHQNFVDPIGLAPLGLQDDVKFHTHAYARRQITWLRRMKYIRWCKTTVEAQSLVRQWLAS